MVIPSRAYYTSMTYLLLQIKNKIDQNVLFFKNRSVLLEVEKGNTNGIIYILHFETLFNNNTIIFLY